MALLELNNISMLQGDFELQVPQLTLQRGQLYVLRGENGSGKSTLLRLLALLQQPQRGEICFAGEPIAWRAERLQALRQKITLLDQNPFLFAGSVEKNLAFGLKLRGIHGDRLRQKIDQALAVVGLSGFQKRRAKELSGGESRRVALARALCLQPKLLLLDEPTANLDIGQVGVLEKFLVSLPQQGMTVVIASHDSGQAERIGGEVVQMARGKLIDAPAVTPELKVV
ncbi:carbohydrate ABC transporter ATP-binding protein, CUT1 family [Malonomonas rubra DSM 5091]|uniref:Carbohydrate ABC transporter ATP-binding protein, CUT1 family n=1 Tax=Malonomonas rubra DSM 5091 TaxID=1122189 RepID=A0A1M6JQP1_MALRU|nr:ABC transporter ATP-binding protein [Malonomonas rubra]SHJ48956.1 carbohydrate ABC transporter ATP-binding protein, CUT1 family [Malonomonas rubra DSM 5091]